MNETRELLIATINEILEDGATVEAVEKAKEEGWIPQLWRTIEESEFASIAIPESAGGAGGDLGDAAALVQSTGAYAASVPLAESALLAGPLLAEAGLDVPHGALTIAPVLEPETIRFAGGRLSGSARRVPYARFADRIVVLAPSGAGAAVLSVDPSRCRIVPGTNLAMEPRDDVFFEDIEVAAGETGTAAGWNWATLQRRGALARAIQMSGALERVLALSVQYAAEREQFGRPIGRFQIIQQYLALAAAEVAAAKAAVAVAIEAASGEGAEFTVAVAKVRAGQAADATCALAHQIHGAIGFTAEHRLHHFTTRLWAWRDEFGTTAEWAERLGRIVIARGADALWPSITD